MTSNRTRLDIRICDILRTSFFFLPNLVKEFIIKGNAEEITQQRLAEMDSGPSWADQWDYQNPDPLPQPASDDGKKKKDAKGKFGKTLLSLKWIKGIGKKSQKSSNQS
ncbi:hypothetical protein HS088_TW06G00671 [Tripterygium wilfordii]|uniref:Uncharacterized protein n=1 Tax=Tripterygium wilfordii TaxID=458696 RepID=A0A7J7DJF7_TRIWF|nr:hypothetical protein HS088_TW06G00671 [Tripterygium wilfordii]